MWDSFTEVIPAPVLIGVCLVGGSAYLMAPEAGRRLADLTAMTQCRETADAIASDQQNSPMDRRLGMAALSAIAGHFEGTLIGEVGEQWASQLQSAEGQSISNVADVCRCLVEEVVFDPATRAELTVWLLSLRMIEQRRVANIGSELATKARLGLCRREVVR